MQKDDLELVQEILSGSLVSFDILMERYQELVYRILLGFAKNREDAMDISQNVFLKAYENLLSFKGSGSFKSWLLRIARNEGVNWLRKNKVYADQAEFDDSLILPTPNLSQEDELLAREHRSQLIRSLFALNTRYRLAVVLRYFENMPIREIAGVLHCSEGVVKNMLFRSLVRLKKQLQEKSGEMYNG